MVNSAKIETLNQVTVKGHTIHGWLSPEEGNYYRQLASAIYNGTIIEIGVFDGLSMSYIADICQQNKNQIIGIDLYLRPSALWLQQQYSETIKLIQTSSKLVSRKFKKTSVNLVFIDGDHSYWSVDTDIKCWEPKLKHGHWMFGHDYGNVGWPDVEPAVKANLPKHKYIPTFYGLWAWRKPPFIKLL